MTVFGKSASEEYLLGGRGGAGKAARKYSDKMRDGKMSRNRVIHCSGLEAILQERIERRPVEMSCLHPSRFDHTHAIARVYYYYQFIRF